MKIAVASGKGGTGKTTVAANLALAICEDVLFLDCDVEGANAHLFLKPKITVIRPVEVPFPLIDASLCDGCGKCVEFCQFSSLARIRRKIKTLPNLCHGCGGCELVCPRKAITMVGRRVGQVERGAVNGMTFACGELDIGEALGVPIIRELKTLAGTRTHTIIDCPPGTSCPVVESVRGCDFCLMVTEPTPFGLHDLKLMMKVVEKVDMPYGLVINRAQGPYEPLVEFCRISAIPVLMRIPFDRRIAELYSKGELLNDHIPGFRNSMRNMFREIVG